MKVKLLLERKTFEMQLKGEVCRKVVEVEIPDTDNSEAEEKGVWRIMGYVAVDRKTTKGNKNNKSREELEEIKELKSEIELMKEVIIALAKITVNAGFNCNYAEQEEFYNLASKM